MAYNLTITIPNDLWGKIQRWRGRLQLASICQRALAAEVRKLESVPQDVKDMEATIERLRKEAQDYREHSYAEGYERGQGWAEDADYADLVHFPDLRQLLREQLPSDFNILPDEERELSSEWDSVEYQRGWLAAVIDFYDRVAAKL